MITLNIDGKEVRVRAGSTVLEAVREAGVYIPTLCYHPDLSSFGGCRLCLVEIEGMARFPPACTTPAADAMVVQTNTPRLQALRRTILEGILLEHPSACLFCDRKEHCEPFHITIRKAGMTTGCRFCPKNGHCELQEVVNYIGIEEITLPPVFKDFPVRREVFFKRDYNLCILCGRCVRMCEEVRGPAAITFSFRGSQATISTAYDYSLHESGCQFCGACVDVCPTGALSDYEGSWTTEIEREVLTTCPYCGVGCQLRLEVNKGRILRGVPALDNSVNQGQACVKGRFGLDFIHSPERLTEPLIKENGEFIPVSWERALDLVASKFLEHKGSFAVISSAKCTNEENYLIQKFARAVMGTNNVDQCARLCQSATIVALSQAFGIGAMTNSIQEIRDAACIFLIGSNICVSHPVISLEVRKAISKGAKLIVANPKQVELCQLAHSWLRLYPGTDTALLTGMARVILDEGLADKTFISERCTGFEDFQSSLNNVSLAWVAEVTGVSELGIREAARCYALNHPATILYATGVTGHSYSMDSVLAIANLAMLTGNLGSVSSGVNPLVGQNNVQGACDMGALPDFYPGYQPVSDSTIKKKFEAAWDCVLPEEPGLTSAEFFDNAFKGKLKALYVVGENPALSEPHTSYVIDALKKLDFLVVQDIFLTETARLAHVVLPAASFAEKDGTFTNTERRIQRVREAIKPIGNSKPDWWIICQIAKGMGAKGFDFSHPSEIMLEIAKVTPSYGGIFYERLEKNGFQWPCPTKEHLGTPVLHVDKFVRGKGQFTPPSYRPPAELPNEEYPLILTTGRSLYHYHTGTMTRKVFGLNALEPEGTVEINPVDARELGINQGDRVRVISRRGEVITKAKVTEVSPSGIVYMSFHFAESAANILTNPTLDPVSKIIGFKACAVRVEKA